MPGVEGLALPLASVDLGMPGQGLPDSATSDECDNVLARLSALGPPTHWPEDHRALAAHVLGGLLGKVPFRDVKCPPREDRPRFLAQRPLFDIGFQARLR
jgi:hypothetical protein